MGFVVLMILTAPSIVMGGLITHDVIDSYINQEIIKDYY